MDNQKKEKLSLKGVWAILKDTFKGFYDDKLMKLGASLAYYTVFSMGPSLVVITSLCSFL